MKQKEGLQNTKSHERRRISIFFAIPDIVYRGSILVSFRMDTRHKHAGMTIVRWILPYPLREGEKGYMGAITGQF
jgi:hypothetical protein